MRWLRLSIAGLMAFICYAAIGLTAFASTNDLYYGRLWRDTYYMITVFLLAIATIMAVLSPGRSRARWLGFAVFGWVYLLFGWPDAAGPPLEHGDSTFRPRFPHPTLINWVIFPAYTPAEPHLGPARSLVKPLMPAATHGNWTNFVWHDIQTTLTMATALLGVVVGNFLGPESNGPTGRPLAPSSGPGRPIAAEIFQRPPARPPSPNVGGSRFARGATVRAEHTGHPVPDDPLFAIGLH